MILRVRGRAEFAALSRAERAVREPLTIRAVCRAGAEPPRVAYTISRSVGGAVVRNRLRRRLRAAVSESESWLRAGCAYLVSARPEAVGLTYRELRDTLRACLVDAAPRARAALQEVGR